MDIILAKKGIFLAQEANIVSVYWVKELITF